MSRRETQSRGAIGFGSPRRFGIREMQRNVDETFGGIGMRRNTFSSSKMENDGSRGAVEQASSLSMEITRCIPPCYVACRVIIALRFCTAIRETITRDRVPKRIRRGCDPLKRAILACVPVGISFSRESPSPCIPVYPTLIATTAGRRL
jgi:hypothetical protein